MKDCCKPDAPRGRVKRIFNGISTAIILLVLVAAVLASLIKYING